MVDRPTEKIIVNGVIPTILNFFPRKKDKDKHTYQIHITHVKYLDHNINFMVHFVITIIMKIINLIQTHYLI